MMSFYEASATLTEQVDSLRREDLVDFGPRAQVRQEGPEGGLGEDVRLHGVVLRRTRASSHVEAVADKANV